jgi:hypothetical protein
LSQQKVGVAISDKIEFKPKFKKDQKGKVITKKIKVP